MGDMAPGHAFLLFAKAEVGDKPSLAEGSVERIWQCSEVCLECGGELTLPGGPAQLLQATSPECGEVGSWRSWKEMCPACQVDVWGAGAGSCRDIRHPAQLAAGEVSEGNSFLSPLTWAGVELLTWR